MLLVIGCVYVVVRCLCWKARLLGPAFFNPGLGSWVSSLIIRLAGSLTVEQESHVQRFIHYRADDGHAGDGAVPDTGSRAGDNVAVRLPATVSQVSPMETDCEGTNSAVSGIPGTISISADEVFVSVFMLEFSIAYLVGHSLHTVGHSVHNVGHSLLIVSPSMQCGLSLHTVDPCMRDVDHPLHTVDPSMQCWSLPPHC